MSKITETQRPAPHYARSETRRDHTHAGSLGAVAGAVIVER